MASTTPNHLLYKDPNTNTIITEVRTSKTFEFGALTNIQSIHPPKFDSGVKTDDTTHTYTKSVYKIHYLHN